MKLTATLMCLWMIASRTIWKRIRNGEDLRWSSTNCRWLCVLCVLCVHVKSTVIVHSSRTHTHSHIVSRECFSIRKIWMRQTCRNAAMRRCSSMHRWWDSKQIIAHQFVSIKLCLGMVRLAIDRQRNKSNCIGRDSQNGTLCDHILWIEFPISSLANGEWSLTRMSEWACVRVAYAAENRIYWDRDQRI